MNAAMKDNIETLQGRKFRDFK